MFNVSPPPSGAMAICRQLKDAGYQAFFVGGCVRDSLLGKTPKDWDICTSARPEEVRSVLKDVVSFGSGEKHGVVEVFSDGSYYDVATFRFDGSYSDGRHPDTVSYTGSIVDDLARRDFTINAMAWDGESELIDPFGGEKDLRKGIIRCVDLPVDRFSEDSLRILRALRFSSVLQFKIEKQTSAAIHRLYGSLYDVSAERITSELLGLLCGEGVTQVLIDYSDVISFIIPELAPCVGFDQKNKYHCYTIYDHIAHAVGASEGNDPVIKVALLLHDIGKPLCYTEDKNGGHFHGHGKYSYELAKKSLSRLRLDRKSSDAILQLVLYHDSVIEPTKKIVRKWMAKLGEPLFAQLLEVRYADILSHRVETQRSRLERLFALRGFFEQVKAEDSCLSLKDLAISGRDILSLGVEEGKGVGEILHYLFDSVLSEELENDRGVLLEAAKRKVQEI